MSADSGETVATLDVFDEPYSVVSSEDGSRLFATLDFPGQVLEIDGNTWEMVRSIDAGHFLRGLAFDESANRVYVTEYYTAVLKAIDLGSGDVVDEWSGSEQDNLARQVTLHPTRPKIYLPHIRSRVAVAHGSGSIFPYLAISDSRESAKTRPPSRHDGFIPRYVCRRESMGSGHLSRRAPALYHLRRDGRYVRLRRD